MTLGPTGRNRGKPSAASLLAVTPDIRFQRPPPPEKLSREEAAIWTGIVASVRPGWFWSSEFLLEMYCRVLAHEKLLSDWIKKTAITDPHYVALQKMRRSEAMLAATLATRLRLTPRSTVSRYTPKIVSARKPWDDDPEPDPLVDLAREKFSDPKSFS
jgi:hypothetical protein